MKLTEDIIYSYGKEIINSVTNREWAALVWIVFVLILMTLTMPDSVRNILKTFLKLFREPIVQVVLFWNSVVLLCLICLQYAYHFETTYWFVKDYCLIVLTMLFPFIIKMPSNQFTMLLKDSLIDLFQIGTFILFVYGQYTFSFCVEMIIWFIITVLCILGVVGNEKRTLGKIISQYSLRFLIVMLVCYSWIQLFINWHDIVSMNWWLAFGLETVVLVMNIPMLIITMYLLRVEYIISMSNRKRSVFTMIEFLFRIYYLRFKYRKILQTKVPTGLVTQYRSFGGAYILIQLDLDDYLDVNLVQAIILKCILGIHEKPENITSRNWYPNIVLLVNKNKQLLGYWQNKDSSIVDRGEWEDYEKVADKVVEDILIFKDLTQYNGLLDIE